MKYLLLTVLMTQCVNYLSCTENNVVDPEKCKIYGPGLKADKIVMPARYFYIESYNEDGERINKSPEDIFKVEISGVSNIGECRIWTETLDRHDGSFIIRYKVYNTCFNLKIEINYKNKAVANSPYTITGSVHSETCYCPTPKFSKWLKEYECTDYEYPQILEDLEPFPTVNFTEFRTATIKRFDRPGSVSICNYVIKNNQVHRRCYGEHVGFKMFWDNILLSLSRKVRLPDVELLVNLGDWPLVFKDKEFKELHTPMLSWCGSEETADIVVPTYDITEASLECMGRVTLDMLSIQGRTSVAWEEREPKAFWRGRDSRRERLDLIKIARENPDLFNASLTNFFFFRDEEKIYGPKEKHVSFFEFFKYKYQLNLDGTVAAYRFPYLLAGGSLVLKQESQYYEHFYKQLIPGEHYVPFARDLSDLVTQIQWAMDHDEEAQRIARKGKNFARDNLAPQSIFCYHARLLNEWSKRLVSPVKVRKQMELVPQPEVDVKYGTCNCEILQKDEVKPKEKTTKKDEL
ncbi:hypothetical protein B566_EDAN001679 [Ephemera danica]|nr:hypothetical protein B566_EDAN001679 [Ephemera danica]